MTSQRYMAGYVVWSNSIRHFFFKQEITDSSAPANDRTPTIFGAPTKGYFEDICPDLLTLNCNFRWPLSGQLLVAGSGNQINIGITAPGALDTILHMIWTREPVYRNLILYGCDIKYITGRGKSIFVRTRRFASQSWREATSPKWLSRF